MADQIRSNNTAAALDARLSALETKLATFEQDHEPEDTALAAALRARQAVLRQKVNEAVAKDDVWAMIGAELERDFDAFAGEVETIFLGEEDASGAGPQTGADDARR